MRCPRCGERNDEGNIQCLSCGSPMKLPAPAVPREVPPQAAARPAARPIAESGERIPDYFLPALLATVLCCLPAGGMAVFYSLQANARRRAGDVEGARAASRLALRWLIVAVVVSLLLFGAGIALSVLGRR